MKTAQIISSVLAIAVVIIWTAVSLIGPSVGISFFAYASGLFVIFGAGLIAFSLFSIETVNDERAHFNLSRASRKGFIFLMVSIATAIALLGFHLINDAAFTALIILAFVIGLAVHVVSYYIYDNAVEIDKKPLIMFGGIGIIVMVLAAIAAVHVVGVYSKASKYFYPAENDPVAKGIISIANKTQEAKTFLRMYPHAVVDAHLQAMGCPEEMGGAGSKYEYACPLNSLNFLNPTFNWVVQYGLSEEANSLWTEPSVRVVIGRDGEILGIFATLTVNAISINEKQESKNSEL